MDLFKFKLSGGKAIDLDDVNNGYYRKEDLEKTWASLRLDCYYQLGYAVICMDYIDNDVDWGKQRQRIDDFIIKELKVNHNYDDKMYWLKLLFRIEDEIENLC